MPESRGRSTPPRSPSTCARRSSQRRCTSCSASASSPPTKRRRRDAGAEAAFNQTGNLHGGAIATLIDVACGSTAARASSFQPGSNTLVTADLHVRYLGRPKGDVVRAEAQVMRAGRQLVVVECRVVDPGERDRRGRLLGHGGAPP